MARGPALRPLLADRACLVLGLCLGGPVVTADRAWGKLDVEIVPIR